MKPNLRLFLTSLILLCAITIKAQEPEKPKIEIKAYGFVNYEIIMDTYKSLDARDGELYFYPLKENLDINGVDKNKQTQLQMLSLSSRLGLKISGPDILGAKTSGLVEADFFATANEYSRLLSLRHLIINLKWEKSELMLGHYWHPVIVNEVIPANISFGAGVPINALNRSPQVRFSVYPTDIVKISFTALTQGYHKSAGPSDAQRNSGLPEVIAQASIGNRKDFVVGASAGYKWLNPRLETITNFSTNKTIGQYLVNAYIMSKFSSTTVKAMAIYGQNLTHLNMIGGYGSITGTGGIIEQDYDYTSLKTLGTWLDLQQGFGKFGVGLFLGYSKLLGADDDYSSLTVGTTKYFRNDDMDYFYRISPRVSYKEENLTFALEYMLTGAVYGETWDAKHKVTSSMDPVYNNRITFAAKYDF